MAKDTWGFLKEAETALNTALEEAGAEMDTAFKKEAEKLLINLEGGLEDFLASCGDELKAALEEEEAKLNKVLKTHNLTEFLKILEEEFKEVVNKHISESNNHYQVFKMAFNTLCENSCKENDKGFLELQDILQNAAYAFAVTEGFGVNLNESNQEKIIGFIEELKPIVMDVFAKLNPKIKQESVGIVKLGTPNKKV